MSRRATATSSSPPPPTGTIGPGSSIFHRNRAFLQQLDPASNPLIRVHPTKLLIGAQRSLCDFYEVSLKKRPAGMVVVSVSCATGGTMLMCGAEVYPKSLVFTPLDWSTSKRVLVFIAGVETSLEGGGSWDLGTKIGRV